MPIESNSEFRRCISEIVCLCLLFQSTGIAAALPLPGAKTYLTDSELEGNRSVGDSAVQPASDRWGVVSEL